MLEPFCAIIINFCLENCLFLRVVKNWSFVWKIDVFLSRSSDRFFQMDIRISFLGGNYKVFFFGLKKFLGQNFYLSDQGHNIKDYSSFHKTTSRAWKPHQNWIGNMLQQMSINNSLGHRLSWKNIWEIFCLVNDTVLYHNNDELESLLSET